MSNEIEEYRGELIAILIKAIAAFIHATVF